MEKKHRPQKSFAGDPSSKTSKTGIKKTQDKSHASQKSNANIEKIVVFLLLEKIKRR